MNEFKVVCIIGSMRFYSQMLEVAQSRTLDGEIVLMPFVSTHIKLVADDTKDMLDRMHRVKMDMADEIVLVTNSVGYIGVSTQAELCYASETNKPVSLLRSIDGSTR